MESYKEILNLTINQRNVEIIIQLYANNIDNNRKLDNIKH